MKILLLASIHGKKANDSLYQKLVDEIKKTGNSVKADHILKTSHENIAQMDEKKNIDFHVSIIEQTKKADAIFAELSYTSTSVGYLVALAAESGKPVVIFYSGAEEPHLFKTLEKTNERIAVVRYQRPEDLERLVPQMVDFISENQDVRFNFFLTPTLSSYLDWVSRTYKVPRSVYLRRLIDEDMIQNQNEDE